MVIDSLPWICRWDLQWICSKTTFCQSQAFPTEKNPDFVWLFWL